MQTPFRPRLLSISTLLTASTLVASLTISYLANRSFFGNVDMASLRSFGGTTFEDLGHLEVWRVVPAQLMHAKMPHMIINAISLFLIATLVESRAGAATTFAIWLVAGGIATAISPILISPPRNVGTGASQATFAFAGCATIFGLFGLITRRLAWALIALVVVPGAALDLFYAGYIKPGHLAGFCLGMLCGGLYVKLQLADDSQAKE